MENLQIISEPDANPEDIALIEARSIFYPQRIYRLHQVRGPTPVGGKMNDAFATAQQPDLKSHLPTRAHSVIGDDGTPLPESVQFEALGATARKLRRV
jgi:hypothetical protein